MKLRKVTHSPLEDLIVTNITNEELDVRLEEQIDRGCIEGEQWFRNYYYWYSVPGFANPYKTPFEELPLLLKEEDALKPILARTLKVFYGLGIGDTEIVPVTWDLRVEKKSEIYAIDVVRDFIENFIQGLRNLIVVPEFRSSSILFLGNTTLFEKLAQKDFEFEGVEYARRTHICFGNTIGNFDQETIFSVFEKTVRKGDYLLLGYHLNDAQSAILDQYETNFRFQRFFLACLEKYTDIQSKKLRWDYNKQMNTVEAWLGDTLAFRSKKYDQVELENFVRKFGFEVVRRKLTRIHFKFGLVGISLLEKT